ncbi:MAG: winged helix-turn-helix domain-containing protein [Pseudomonadota bacterium]
MTAKRSPKFNVGDFQIDSESLTIIGPLGETSVEPKVMQVLSLLAEANGETVLRETFMDRVWGVAFGSDESLTRAISILRKIFKDQRGRRAMIETVPRKGYRLVAPVTELTSLDASGAQAAPTKMSSEERTSSPETISKSDPRKSQLNPITLAAFALVLLMILGMTSVWLLDRSSETALQDTTERHLVRFIGLDNQSDESGIAQSLTATLPSVFSSASIPIVGLDTNSDLVAEFNLRGRLWTDEGTSIAIDVTHADTGRLILSETYQVDDAERADLDYRISVKLASILNCMMEWRGNDYPNTAQAISDYARYCDAFIALQLRDYSPLSQAIYDLEPDNPAAIALHAYSVWSALLRNMERPEADRERFLDEIDQLIEKGQQIDSDSSILQGIALLIKGDQGDLVEAASDYPKIVANSGLPRLIYNGYSWHLRKVGRNLEARQVLTRYADSHPLYAGLMSRIGWLSAVEGDKITAERYFLMGERIKPDEGELIERRRQAALYYGDKDQLASMLGAIPIADQVNSTGFQNCLRVFIEVRLSDDKDPDPLIEACSTGPKGSEFNFARQLSAIGAIDKAYDAIEGFDWSTTPGSTIVLFYREMAGFRADPRFWPLMEEIGLYDYWVQTEQWPDFCLFEDHPGRCPEM